MSHSERPITGRKKQTVTRKRTSRRRRRLLKGCEQAFQPRHARQRYCSPGCQQAAKDWSQWKARQRYRATKRAKQNATTRAAVIAIAFGHARHNRRPPPSSPRGSSLGTFFEHTRDRPGCCERFHRSPRSPLRRFCSHACRRALERVWEGERRRRPRHNTRTQPPALTPRR